MALRTSAEIEQHLRNVLGLAEEEPEKKRPRRRESETDSEQPWDYDDIDEAFTFPNASKSRPLSREEDNTQAGHGRPETAVPHPLFKQGTDIYKDDEYIANIKAVSHKRRTQYSLSDHLFDVKIRPRNQDEKPYLINLEEVIGKALVNILDQLKEAYDAKQNQNQIYITIIDKNILKGINTGNYSLHTPSFLIARWVMALLYHYLKSEQTLRLNDTFKIQIKVLSARHVRDLEKKKPRFRHVYH